jgi:hypothetical protein
MYPPGRRSARMPTTARLIVAALAFALMGMGGVALAAPNGEPGPPDHAQGNGPPPQANNPTPPHGPPPDAGPAPSPDVKPEPKGPQDTGGPTEAPQDLPAQAVGGDRPQPTGGQGDQIGSPQAGQGGGPARGEARSQPRPPSNPNRIGVGDFAESNRRTPGPRRAGTEGGDARSELTGGKKLAAAGAVLGASEERAAGDRGGTARGHQRTGDAAESGSVFGMNQGGGAEADDRGGSFDGALPFTGLQLLLIAAVGLALTVAGVRIRRWAP